MKNKSVILGIIIVIVVVLLTGCGFYNLVDATEFKQHFGALGYTTSDTEEPKYENDIYLVASKEDVPFKIEYYEFDEELDAKKTYASYVNSIAEYITTNSKNNETTGAVMAKMVVESDNEYIIISRVKNTLIFVNGTKDYKNEINTLLEDIKY